MKVLLDETGSFNAGTKGIGILTLVSISESDIKSFNSFYVNFLKKLPENQKSKKGIPKGNSLTKAKYRSKVYNFLKKHHHIKFYPVVIDCVLTSRDSLIDHRKQQIQRIDDYIEKFTIEKRNQSLFQDLCLFKNQINKLSVSDLIYFLIIVQLIKEWQSKFLFDYLEYDPNKDNWKISFILDQVNKPEKTKRLITGFLKAITGYGINNFKIFTPREWDKSHPFNKIHGKQKIIDGKKLIIDLKFSAEENEPLLLLPDIIGHSLWSAFTKKENSSFIYELNEIRKNRSLTLTLKKKNSFYTINIFRSNPFPGTNHPFMQIHRFLQLQYD